MFLTRDCVSENIMFLGSRSFILLNVTTIVAQTVLIKLIGNIH